MSRPAATLIGLHPGQVVGSYRIQRTLGGGGMGMVYAAEHVLIGRRAAIKVLRPEYGHVPAIVQRFLNEARATTAIRHPGIVEVFDFGYTDDGYAFIAMELLEGQSLAERLTQVWRLPLEHVLVLARRIAAALAAAHARGIVHRDLKPDNVFLIPDPDGGVIEQVKLLDFGIAKLCDDVAAVGRTSTGVVLGTPLYMSPEQCCNAGECDHRSDLYSLGCVLFELIAGRPPFSGKGVGDVIAAHMMTPPPDVRMHAAATPVRAAELITWLLAKTPDQRPASAAVVVGVLDEMLESGGRASAMRATAVPGSRPGLAPATSPGRVPAPPQTATPPDIAPRGQRTPPASSHGLAPPSASGTLPRAEPYRPRRFLAAVLVVGGLALAAVGTLLVLTASRWGTGAPPAVPSQPAVAAAAPDARMPDADVTSPPMDSLVDAAPASAVHAGPPANAARARPVHHGHLEPKR